MHFTENAIWAVAIVREDSDNLFLVNEKPEGGPVGFCLVSLNGRYYYDGQSIYRVVGHESLKDKKFIGIKEKQPLPFHPLTNSKEAVERAIKAFCTSEFIGRKPTDAEIDELTKIIS